MKKLTLLIATFFFMAAMPFSGFAINPYLQGDVNDDARVNIDDVTDLINALLTGTTNSFDGYADVDGNGSVTIDDLTELIAILMGDVPENENTISVTLPEDAPITVDEVVVVGYGIEIAPSTSLRHMREAGKRYYVTDANTISVLTRDGKLVYDSYVSFDVNNRERSVAVDALETAYSMLLPAFINVFDATPDHILNALKTMLAGLDETQALASAIDNSIVRHGYFDINDVDTEYRAAVEKIIDKLGLRDNFLSGTVPGGVSFGAPAEPSVPYGEYGHWGFKLVLNNSEWLPDTGGGGGSWITARDSVAESYGGAWKCYMTAYNYNRFAYTAWTRGYLDENGNVQLYTHDLYELMKHILKPQRVSTFMDIFLDPVNDPFEYKSWDGLKGFFSESFKVMIDPEYHINDMTWDNTKVKFDMEFTSPNDVVVFCGPDCPEGNFMLYYNLIKVLMEPMIKHLCKDLGKAAKGETASEPDFFIILAWELVKDSDYGFQFMNIWENESIGKREKARRIAELTWPKTLTALDNYFRQKVDLWTKDRCMEVFGYKAISDFEAAVENVTKNINAELKMVELLGDISLGFFGLSEDSGYYRMELDFGDKSVNTKEFTVGDVTFTMVEVEGGSFLMGASMEQLSTAHDNEYPLHNVTLSDYYIGQTEVTQELWKAVMGSVPGSNKNPKYPVGGVSWLECQQFITKLNEMTGETFRLPTEAEWEYAARGGNGATSRLYAGSDNLDHVGWYSHNSASLPHTVGSKLPNQLMLYDMSGNAMEWCSDWYGAYSSDAQTNPTGPATGDLRVCRGGGWGYGSDLCRVSCRASFAPSNSMNENLGLRLVWEPSVSTETFTVNGVSFKMVAVEGGTFMMGVNPDDYTEDWYDEKPAHQVTVSSFAIGQTEVTQALWQAVMNSNPSYFTDNLNYPVELVSWVDCQIFIDRLNEITGRKFRLPTEAEWEFAAHGGNLSQNYKYSGSNNINEVAWYISNSSLKTHSVATMKPNELGLYDMSGNVWEWIQDWWDFYSNESQVNPTGPESGSYRVVRGGSLDSNPRSCLVLDRWYRSPSYTNYGIGLRLALSDQLDSALQDDHEWVDLGLPSGTLWATCNVGANAPEDYGDYFAWGETAPKDYYDWSTYKWCNGSYTTMTKYCTNSSYGYNGFVDNKAELDPEDDAAYVNWGPSWRMPTTEQQRELYEKCSSVWTTQNGVNGRLFTGPNGNILFLPAAGYHYSDSLYYAGSWGSYWSRTLYSSFPIGAYYLHFSSENVYWHDYYRFHGFTVRAVRVSQN